MSVSYKDLIANKRNDSLLVDLIKFYEKTFGKLGNRNIKNAYNAKGSEILCSGEFWYRAIVRPFPAINDYDVPPGLEDQYDWPLLSQLMASSEDDICFITVSNFSKRSLRIRLKVEMRYRNLNHKKHIDEFTESEIKALFETYIFDSIRSVLKLQAVHCIKHHYIKEMIAQLSHWKNQIKFLERMKCMHEKSTAHNFYKLSQ
jgi:hypothetical protein